MTGFCSAFVHAFKHGGDHSEINKGLILTDSHRKNPELTKAVPNVIAQSSNRPAAADKPIRKKPMYYTALYRLRYKKTDKLQGHTSIAEYNYICRFNLQAIQHMLRRPNP